MPSAIVTPPIQHGESADPLHIEQVPVDALRLSDYNPRQMDAEERAKLERSIAEFGMVDPIIARLEGREVIGGHQRLVAARNLGLATVPVCFLDVTAERAKLVSLALNKIQGTWDGKLLARLLGELDAIPDLDLTITGFDDDDIKAYAAILDAESLAEKQEEFDLDKAIETARENSRARRGEIWELGRHRLMCGDATSTADMARLCAGDSVDVVVTDPPYSIDYVPAGERAGRASATRPVLGPILNDAMAPEDYQRLLDGAFTNAVGAMHEGGALYLFGCSSTAAAYAQAFDAAGIYPSSTIVWLKPSASFCWKDYRPQYELLHYGWAAGKPHGFYGDRTNTDVWPIARDPAASYHHPTQKPTELYERALENSSRPGQTLLDMFVGGGAALIAAERTGRRCLAMDLDERFCEVSIQRWEQFTGQSARRSS